MPVLAAGCLTYGAAANFLLPRLWVQKAGGKAGKLPPVEGWRMPKGDGYCLMGALALGYLLLLAGGEAYVAVGRMLVGILGAAFRGVGICVAAYFLLVRVRSRAGRVAIAAGLSLLAPGLFTAIGVAEQLFGIRKRFVIIKRKP